MILPYILLPISINNPLLIDITIINSLIYFLINPWFLASGGGGEGSDAVYGENADEVEEEVEKEETDGEEESVLGKRKTSSSSRIDQEEIDIDDE